MKKFNLGQLVVSSGINTKLRNPDGFTPFVFDSLDRHSSGDWGDMTLDDKLANDRAIEDGGRIFSSFEPLWLPAIWIITEADRSSTTILFPEEY